MKKNNFVDAFRGKDARDKNPHLRRVIQEANLSDVFYCIIYILSVLLIAVSIGACVIALILHKWVWLWTGTGAALGVGGIILALSMIGPVKYEHVPISTAELKTYIGKYVYIHWLNDVTGYADEWVPFYGNTEEFVRYNNGRPELCVAPIEQYGRGWVAYAHKIQKDELPTRRNSHESS